MESETTMLIGETETMMLAGALIGAGGIFLGSILQYFLRDMARRNNYEAQRKMREEENFKEMAMAALDYCSGRTQNRNIGISVILSLWDHPLADEFRDVYKKSWILVFTNQCTYIMKRGRNRFQEHELDNLRRMMRKILEFDEFRRTHSYKSEKSDLIAAIGSYKVEASNKKDFDMTNISGDLDTWMAEIKKCSPVVLSR